MKKQLDFTQEIKKIFKAYDEEYEKAEPRTFDPDMKIEGNIYFLFSNDDLKYIGQRSSEDINIRLKNHLQGLSAGSTGSKWDEVQAEIKAGKKITFKTILVKPDSLRKTLKEEFIKKHPTEWNKHQK